MPKKTIIIASLAAVLLAGAVIAILVARTRAANEPDRAAPGISETADQGTGRESALPSPESAPSATAAGIVPPSEDAPRSLPDAAFMDGDKDGLSDLEEGERRTDPAKADTDGDGLSDGDEAHLYCTDPAKARTDGSTPDAERVARANAEAALSGQRARYCVE